MAWLSINYESKILHMPVVVDVLLPQNTKNCRTMYLLHSEGGDHASWIHESRIVRYAAAANLAVVMPSGNNKWFVNNYNGKPYFDFITKELTEQCEKWFSLSGRREDRFIAGASSGGYGAIYAALKRPDLYAYAFSYDGLLDIKPYIGSDNKSFYTTFGDDTAKAVKEYDLYNIAVDCVKDISDVDKLTNFVIMCGQHELKQIINKKLAEQFKSLGYNAEYVQHYNNDTSYWDYFDMCVKESIDRYIYNNRRKSQNGGSNGSY